MSKTGKTDCPAGNDDQEDIQWFENYEKCSKTKHLERLKNEDILNYIKDVEQNCRLEVSSGDEDYAGIKRSSNCSVRYSERKTKGSSGHYAKDACNYCCSTRRFYFRSNPDVTIRENSRRDPNTSTKSIYQRPNLSRNSSKYRASSPTFRGWYSGKDRKAWPTVTETASVEIIRDCQNAIDSRNNKSKITDRKSTKVRTRDETRIRKLNEESDVSGFVNQQPFNKIYSGRDMAFSYYTPLQNGDYKRSYTSGYPVRSSRKPTWGLSSQSNRLTARSPETTPLLQERTLQWEDEVEPQLKASSSIMGAISIDRNYQRKTKRKNNTDQRRQESDVLGERESSCYCRPSLLREFGKLCEVVRSREDKQRVGCCCEDAERDETGGCSRYCRCSENVNDLTRLQYESIRRPITMNRRVNYIATLRRTLSESVQSRDNDEDESEINLSIEEDSQNEAAVYNNHALDVDDDASTNTYDDALDLEYLKPCVSFPGDRARRGSSEVAWKYKKLSNDLKSNQGKAMGAQTTLREKITARYPKGKEFFYAIKTPGKPVMGDSSGLRYAEDTCECKEPYHDPPAACLTGSCTCIGNDEYEERNDSDSSRTIFDTVYCCCSSSISHDERDPVKKLESFCERVKAVNQDIFRKPSKPSYRNATKINDSDGQNQSAFSTRRATRRARPAEAEQLADSSCPRLEKPRHSHSEANLETVLIYPPREEDGPPLMLFKRSSNISCRVKGDADTGFRYSVTYVQKFVSPTWMPSSASRVPSRETDGGCVCFADYG